MLAIILNEVIFPMAIFGMVFRKPDNDLNFILIMFLNYMLAFITLFSSFGRMSFHSMSIIIIFASYGLGVLSNLKDRFMSGSFDNIIIKKMVISLIFIVYIYGFFIYQVASRYNEVKELIGA